MHKLEYRFKHQKETYAMNFLTKQEAQCAKKIIDKHGKAKITESKPTLFDSLENIFHPPKSKGSLF